MSTAIPFAKNVQNPLLLKDDVGKAKPTTYNLPQEQAFVFGKALKKDQEGAKEGMFSFNSYNDLDFPPKIQGGRSSEGF